MVAEQEAQAGRAGSGAGAHCDPRGAGVVIGPDHKLQGRCFDNGDDIKSSVFILFKFSDQ